MSKHVELIKFFESEILLLREMQKQTITTEDLIEVKERLENKADKQDIAQI